MKHVILLLGVLYYNTLSAQTPYATFQNPSFEGPIQETPPPDWHNCMNSPDTGPYFLGGGGAFDGNNYIGFVSADHTWEEFVSQRLDIPLVAGQNYFFNIYLAADSVPITNRYGKISIWLGDSLCEQKQKVFTSPILNETWNNYVVSFQADSSYNTIQIGGQARNMGNYISYSRADLISPIYEGYPTSVNTPNTTSKDIVVYPNPTTNQLQINGEYTTATLYNLTGQLLLNTTSKQINLADFTQGMYILLCYDAAGRVIHREKVVKQ